MTQSILDEKTGIRTYPQEHTYGSFAMSMESAPVKQVANTSAAQAQETRAKSEIQAAILMAKQSPRNEHQCYIGIIDACKRPSLAEQSLYAYPRGGQLVKGPSIRLAESIARAWGNIRVGVTITAQTDDRTEARAYAYDMQTNYMVDQEFVVPHKRTTKKGVQKLTDERDIRELVANIGSRHLRGCILRLIPADIVEDAVAQVERTLQSSDMPMSEQIKRMITAFDELGVKVEHLEKRLGHNLDATIPAEIVTLKGIYKSIKDGMASREDFFDFPKKDVAADAKEELKNILEKNKEAKKEVKEETKEE
jgi:hypothetical protein